MVAEHLSMGSRKDAKARRKREGMDVPGGGRLRGRRREVVDRKECRSSWEVRGKRAPNRDVAAE